MSQTAAERAAYQAAWRLAHSGYDHARRLAKRALVAEQHRTWKAANPIRVAAQRARYAIAHPRPAIDLSPIPPLHRGHPLFDQARAFVVDPMDQMALYQSVRELDHEDARSEFVLALLEGRDPRGAAKRYLSSERGWRDEHPPLLLDTPWDD